MDPNQTFKTKTGFCHIMPDRIVLTRDGIAGNMAKATIGNTIWRALTIYTILAAVLFYFAFEAFQKGQKSEAIFPGALGIFLLFGILRSLNNSATPVIERNRIQAVNFIKGIRWVTRSRFEVLFADERGNIKKRLIMLPGSLTGGASETEKALELMMKEKLITAH
ncbi:phosphoribosylaminoimidazolesuccinocarboxamide synthase [Hymenobacter terricola]|uniref:phosphoribosylaminoimidazolesuccinocarboxamide synthase n=1 Tax=Hymenobacter terricola TaxID=2819236 RepID=UPI001B314DD8|nr:phosphoribosylaminoimidazolesuccinocarboxamide synthase [Hymenobacter terricola]